MEVEFNGKNLDDFFIKTAKGDEDMTETNANIHVLADETLGGIKREYVEVDREAEVGEKIVIVEKSGCGEGYEIGAIFTVDREYQPKDGDVECDVASSDSNPEGLIYREEYHVLEPTDIVHINGERYELIDRKAEVGEKIVHVNKDCGKSDGVVTEVTDVGSSTIDVVGYEVSEGESVCGISHGYYRVLVPVEAAEDEPKPADPIDVIASLAQEVASLKRTVDRHRDEIDTLYKDKRTLGEELARLAAEIGKETESSAKVLAEAFVALRRAGL
ncbi:hypothetical protein FA037_05670 [Bacillus amyloliquefaciens]|uniref:hypothetical protein n=1 Tax=Bacillus amyloliquefaciens TaxID=1390 RepID=UPI0010ACA932|nr:hypothetical protein [Bacillus amyloliquefaciens]TJZ71408.1 hypothetical protein FA037_05670 [Bacillus amyloliquefaciens]